MSDVRRKGVQYLEDNGLVISTKKHDDALQKKQPPKIKGKHFYNVEDLEEGNPKWLTPDESDWFRNNLYDPSLDFSYFHQCFKPCDKLGEGSFGSVLKVFSYKDNKFYAVKVSKEPFRNVNDRKLKLDEIKHHKELSEHPCIVSLYQAWEEDRYTYMMMELCQHNMAMAQVVPEERCWRVLTDITLALDYIHDLEMGHFDVKLENILYGFDGRYKLSDFGLVYDLQTDDKRSPREGDAKYLAPEVLLFTEQFSDMADVAKIFSKPPSDSRQPVTAKADISSLPPSNSREHFTFKADIFSLGISILELAGNLSLPTNGPVWIALRQNTFPLAQTQKLSDELFSLLVKMMSPDPSLRPSAKEILNLPTVKAFVQQHDNALQTKQPPKITMEHFCNLEDLDEENLVWLTPDDPDWVPRNHYKPSLEASFLHQCFEPYNKLGEGSFGSVIKVISFHELKLYALKVSKEPFRNDIDRQLKRTEVKHHKELSGHPCIVSLYHAWEEDWHTFMIMELCQHNLVQAQVMPEERCWRVLTDITQALHHIHNKGMGHFDVKLKNILYGFDTTYKLSDFGMTCDLETAGWRSPTDEDAKYLAPELLSSQEHFTDKADIFSLGICILELAGNLSLPTNKPVWKALRENNASQTQKLSDQLTFLLERMVSPDPSLRPSAKEILDLPTVKAMAEHTSMVRKQMSEELNTCLHYTQQSTSSAPTIDGQQPLYNSTPYTHYGGDSSNNNEVSLNSQGSDSIVSPANTSFQPVLQVYTNSEWVGRAGISVGRVYNPLRYSSPSLMGYGISPIRLSRDMSAIVKLRKAELEKNKVRVKRNLLDSFEM